MAAQAAEHGLSRSGARLPIGKYLAATWERRHFIVAYSNAKVTSGYAQTGLGWMWEVLNPLLNAMVYFLIFGLLLKKGVTAHLSTGEYIGFLVIGVFLYSYMNKSMTTGSKAIYGNMGLIRALHFPRIALPLSAVLVQLRRVWWSMAVMIGLILASGMKIYWTWLLLPVVVLLLGVFNLGGAMILARLGAKSSDVTQFLPFLFRTWMYLSGVMFSIERIIADNPKLPDWADTLLRVNPMALFLNLARGVMIGDPYTCVSGQGAGCTRMDPLTWLSLHPTDWLVALAWAVGLAVIGFFFFYQGEEEYGRG